MKTFKHFIFEQFIELSEDDASYYWDELNEAASAASKGGASADTKGKLHELLVGYHMLGRHMSKHPDIEGDSPKEAHDKLKAKVSPEDYKNINQRAKEAAADIKARAEGSGHKLHDVHWTSKPGDIERSTGIASTQKQDASDLVIHTKKGKQLKYHGVSLKVTDTTNKHVPVSNPGIESTLGGDKILQKHREDISNKFPALNKATNAGARKELMKSNPKMEAYVKSRNAETLQAIAKNLHNKLKKMPPKDVVDHIQTHVLQTHPTPMQQQGHEHLRHTTFVKGGKNAFHHVDPSVDYSHIYSSPQHITVQHSGTSIHFLHKGKKFASHRIKFVSQSDPLSSIKGSGTPVGD